MKVFSLLLIAICSCVVAEDSAQDTCNKQMELHQQTMQQFGLLLEQITAAREDIGVLTELVKSVQDQNEILQEQIKELQYNNTELESDNTEVADIVNNTLTPEQERLEKLGVSIKLYFDTPYNTVITV